MRTLSRFHMGAFNVVYLKMSVAGVKKAGTTDLFARLGMHPEFIKPVLKEAQWFPRLRFKHYKPRIPGINSKYWCMCHMSLPSLPVNAEL